MIYGTKCGRLSAAALLLATSLAITACAPSDSGNSDGGGTKNIDQWKMPVDEFGTYNADLANYVSQLRIAKCLTSQGYEWPVPWQNTDFPLPADFNQAHYRLFNMTTAKKWGYHFAPAADPRSADAMIAFSDWANSYHPDDSFDTKFAACGDAAFDKSMKRDGDGLNYLSDLAVQSSEAARQDGDVQAAVQRWRKCLTPKVDFAVPDSPWSAMPPLSVGESLGLTGQDQTSTASKAEIDIAVADAGCRDSSGLQKTLYDLEWDLQQKLVKENRDKLDRIRRDANSHNKELLKIVAENAPPAP